MSKFTPMIVLGLLLIASAAQAQNQKNYLSFGLQFPFRWVNHEQDLVQTSGFDSYRDGDTSWDGSIGHYFELGRYFGNQARDRDYRCSGKIRGDFDYRSDHDVMFETNHELELDLSIFSMNLAGECERALDDELSLYLEAGGGLSAHVNSIKYKRGTDARSTDLPDFIVEQGLVDGTTQAYVDLDYEPAALLGIGAGYKISPAAGLRMGLQYRYMGTNHVYDQPINELVMTFGLRAGF